MRGPQKVLWVEVVTTSLTGVGSLAKPGNDEADDMCDVGEEIGADVARDPGELTEGDRPRIGCRPDDHDPRLDPFPQQGCAQPTTSMPPASSLTPK